MKSNIGDSRSAKSVFRGSEVYEVMHFYNAEIDQTNKIQSPKNSKMAVLEPLDSPKSISRKI